MTTIRKNQMFGLVTSLSLETNDKGSQNFQKTSLVNHIAQPAATAQQAFNDLNSWKSIVESPPVTCTWGWVIINHVHAADNAASFFPLVESRGIKCVLQSCRRINMLLIHLTFNAQLRLGRAIEPDVVEQSSENERFFPKTRKLEIVCAGRSENDRQALLQQQYSKQFMPLYNNSEINQANKGLSNFQSSLQVVGLDL